VRERALVEKRPLATAYVKNNNDEVTRHLRPYHPFKGLALKDLTAGRIRDWMGWAAVYYAVHRDELARDPFAKIGEAREEARGKGMLTLVELARLIAVSALDPRLKAALLLAAFCGLRRGEVRGHTWTDADPGQGVLHISHNFLDSEGVKAPKCRSTRTVLIPDWVRITHDAIKAISPHLA
jgi:integrase